MIVTVFRSRLKPGLREDYVALANRMKELAQTIPGYISHKDFYAQDGERVAIVEFAHEEGQRAWQTNPEHLVAQKMADKNITPSTAFRCARLIVSRNLSYRSRRRRRLDRRASTLH